MSREFFYFPGWTRKAMSFTIDDGNIPLDTKFLNIVKPAGIIGTFNLCLPKPNMTPEKYRELYRGYGIANHCAHHPLAFDPSKTYPELSDEKFDIEKSDTNYLYKSDIEGMYYYRYTANYWSVVATNDTYLKLIDECQVALEEIFGKDGVDGFVWPYGKQRNPELLERIKADGKYTSVRRTVCSTFDLPKDRFDWSYCAHHENMTERAAEFEALEDDGELKWFCFGVHSHDFENNNCWDVLENFAEKYGNRPEDFWYASVRDIFDYEDAVNAATVTDTEIVNNSEKTLYIVVNGKRVTLFPHAVYKF